jgi:hypothetical protein
MAQPPGNLHDFQLFLSTSDSSVNCCSGYGGATRLEKCGTAVAIVDGMAYQLISSNGQVRTCEVHEFTSDQKETDTRVILYLHCAAKLGYMSAVVRTPDSFFLLRNSHSIGLKIDLDIGTGKHRHIINVTELAKSLEPEYCTTLLGFYVFSGEDCTSAFKGKGKVTPLKKLQKNPKYHKAFRHLGDEWTVKPKVMADMEAFTCLLYGHAVTK